MSEKDLEEQFEDEIETTVSDEIEEEIEEEIPEDDSVDEDDIESAIELNRHPHSDDEEEEEITDEEQRTNADGEVFKTVKLDLPKSSKIKLEIHILEANGKFYTAHDLKGGTYGSSGWPTSKKAVSYNTYDEAFSGEINKLANGYEKVRNVLEKSNYGTLLQEEKPKQVKCPNVNCTFHLELKEGNKCINCGFTFTKENMAEFVDKDEVAEANEEFANGIVEQPKKPLTQAQIKAKQIEITEKIEETQQRIDLLAPIEELAKSTGFEKLSELIKNATFDKIEDKKFGEGKKGIQVLEAIDLVEEKAHSFCSEYYGKKREIKQLNEEYERLQCPQLDLFVNNPDAENNTSETAETATPAETDDMVCMYCKADSKGYAKVDDVELGEGWICKVCYDKSYESFKAEPIADAETDVLDAALDSAIETKEEVQETLAG